MSRSSWPLVAGLLASLVTSRAGHAELVCPTPVVEVGEVRSGAPLVHTFTFVNRGPAPVEIVGVRPSCGCLTPHLDRGTLAPREEGHLALEVNTLTPADGPENWRCTLVYREADQNRELVLALSGRVKCEIRVDPAALSVSTRSEAHLEIVVTDPRARPFTVTGASTTSAHLRAQAAEPRTNASGPRIWSVRLDVLAGLPEGRHEEWVRIATDDPTYPELKVSVTVEKRRRESVVAAPSFVEWTVVAREPLPARTVLLRACDEQDVVVEKAECDQPGVHCTWARGPGALATLRLTADPARLAPGARQGSVRVHLSKPAAETITLPVSWDVR